MIGHNNFRQGSKLYARKLINRRIFILGVLFLALFGIFAYVKTSKADTLKEAWHVLPIRSHEQWDKYSKGDASQIGGEGMQHPRSMVRSKSDPNVIYMAQDVGAVWKSTDGGTTWNHTVGKGLNNDYMYSVAVDPVNPKKIFVLTGSGWDVTLKSKEGLYVSSNSGDDWNRSLAVGVDNKAKADYAMGSREHQENIAYDPTSLDANGAKVWYAAVDCGQGTGQAEDCYLYKSENYGASWNKIESSYFGGHGNIHNLVVSPSNSKVLYFSSTNGLYKSSDGGVSFSKVSNGIPSGEVGWVVLDSNNKNKMYVTSVNKGLYVSENNGSSFTLQKSHDKAMSVFINSSNSSNIYLLSNNYTSLAEVSTDGGKTWSKTSTPALGYLHDYWPRTFAGEQSAVLPDPRDPKKAVAYFKALIFKTADGGKTWSLSSNLFAGHGCNRYSTSIYFDPSDSKRFGFFCYDFGMTQTANGGGSFDIGRMSDSFVQTNAVENKHIFAGSIKPGSGGQDIVASGGDKRKIIRSTDGGKNWSIINFDYAGVDFVRHHPTDGQTVYAGRWISRDGGKSFQFKKIDPNSTLVTIVDTSKDGNSLLATEIGSAKNVWRSKDKGNSWEKVASFDYNINNPGRYPSIAIHPTDNNIFYFKDSKGDISKYDISKRSSASLSLKAKNTEINLDENKINSIAIDPVRPEVIYAHTTVPGTENIWRSLNGGVSWENISKNLPRVTNYRLAVNPHTGDLFAGSMIGNWVYPRPAQYASSYSKPSIVSTAIVANYGNVSLTPTTPSQAPTQFPPPVTTPIPTPVPEPKITTTATLSESSSGPYYELATIKLKLTTGGANIKSAKLFLDNNTLIEDNNPPFDEFVVGGAKAGQKKYTAEVVTTSGDIVKTNVVVLNVLANSIQEPSDNDPPSAPLSLNRTLYLDWFRMSYGIILRWNKSTDNVGVKNYIISRNDKKIGTTSNNYYKDYRVSAGTKYTYSVQAVDDAGNTSSPASVQAEGYCFLIWCSLK